MKKQRISFCLLIIMIVILAAAVSGCGPTLSNADLYNTGIEMTSLMGEMVKSSTYLDIIGMLPLDDLTANDYDTPIRTYVIEVPSNENILEIAVSDKLDELKELPENLREQLCALATFDSVITEILFESTEIHESPMYLGVYAQKTLEGNLKNDVAYLYVFETGKPIIVHYHQQAKNSITVKARFIGKNIFETLSDTRDVFEKFGCKVSLYS